MAKGLEDVVNRLAQVAMKMGKIGMSPDYRLAFAHATPFLYAMGDTIMGWMLLWRAVISAGKIEGSKGKDLAFYTGQIKTADFFINTILPITKGKMDAIETACPAALEIEEDAFGGL
jgi:hypothetical protein